MLKYGEAIHAALVSAMKADPRVFVMGIGVDDHKAVFGTTRDLVRRFGKERVFDTPISEAAMTGVALGAALGGLRPVHIHIRADFLYLAMDQILNMAAKWRSMFGGSMSAPLVIRAVVGRSWGQGAQHSQSPQSLFMHVPGLKIAMPTMPGDAYELLLAALDDSNPVILIEHRLLYDVVGQVGAGALKFPRTVVRRTGRDLTIVANSYMVIESLRAAEFLARHGVSAEVVDPVTLSPLDDSLILESVAKTGHLLLVDASWTTCGVSAEIAARAAEKVFDALKAPIRRLGMQPVVCPVSKPLERLFYPNPRSIATEAFALLDRDVPSEPVPIGLENFRGPF